MQEQLGSVEASRR